MVKRMLVDATHPEETRVVVVNGTKLEEFDFETSTKKQLKGNIYLAKVIRIEPSLQAAFVEYGGNRHGFLAFSEIHPDYYQIPVADREAILAEQERRARQAEEGDGHERPARRRGRHDRGRGRQGDRSQRRGGSSAEDQSPAPADADATDAVATPDQVSGLDDQPTVENWDHEAARSERYRRNEDADTTSAHEDAGTEGDDSRDEDFDDREALNPNGDFRDSDPDWNGTEAGDRDAVSESDAHAEDEDEPAETATGAGPRSYVAERQDWPVTYSETSSHDGDDEGADGKDTISSNVASDTVAAAPEQSHFATAGAPAPSENEAPASGSEAQDRVTDITLQTGTAEGGATSEILAESTTTVETVGGDDLGEEERPRRAQSLRNYKIQEVIKRRQILLVQVVKEERGNKGAALTTYLSLAGRYCVLMPNAGRGGGISRKITNAADRKRMREMLSELEVPQGMGVILRTAGLERSKPEIRRDYDYLIRLWDNIREITLKSTAPALIYEEGNLIKRSIRDLYGKDIEELQIEGEDAYRNAKEFMRQLMPSHAKKVQQYKEPIPLFHRYQVEAQLDAMHSPVVQLKSGAYIVINPTEALVAIDINSGRSTKERNIEETALRTNVEAAEEIARQLRLRDLAGLIVIDFIDMEDQRHQLQVERRLKEAMRSDRARIQIGRISAFGLLELSRQRLRPSLLETSTEVCPHCEGTGRIRSTESTVLHVLRAIEEEGIRRRAAEIRVTVPTHVALYLLNQKRGGLAEIEMRYGFRVLVDGDDRLIPPNFTLERSRTRPADALATLAPLATAAYDEIEAADEDQAAAQTDAAVVEDIADADPAGDSTGENGGKRRRRRRRRRRGDEADASPDTDGESDDASDSESGDAHDGSSDADEASDRTGPATTGSAEDGEPDTLSTNADDANDENGELTADGQPRRRRRGRRGGRRRRQGDRPDGEHTQPDLAAADENIGGVPSMDQLPAAAPAIESVNGSGEVPHEASQTSPASVADDVQPERGALGNEANALPALTPEPVAPAVPNDAMAAAELHPEPAPEPGGPPRRGWWTRLTSGS